MPFVTDCPKNLSEVEKASKALRCGRDKYNNSQYICLPNAENKYLMEICFDGVMGLHEKGKTLSSLLKHTYTHKSIWDMHFHSEPHSFLSISNTAQRAKLHLNRTLSQSLDKNSYLKVGLEDARDVRLLYTIFTFRYNEERIIIKVRCHRNLRSQRNRPFLSPFTVKQFFL